MAVSFSLRWMAVSSFVAVLLTASLARCVIAADTPDAPSAAVPAPTAPSEPAGMKPMFDGKTLDGWDGDLRLWSVKDGVIHGEATKDASTKGNTFLIWKGGEPADFEMRVTFRLDPNKTGQGNSGVQYRSKHLSSADGKE